MSASGLEGWPYRNVFSVYCAYGLMVHPRPIEWVKLPGKLDADTDLESVFGSGKYLLSYLDASPAAEMGYPIAWQNDDYVIYHLDNRKRKSIWPIDLSNFRVSKKKIKSSSRLLMAWDGCTAAQKEAVELTAGSYELALRLNSEGCAEPPPQLHVEIPGVLGEWIDVTPNDKRVYRLPFKLTETVEIFVNLKHKETPRCESGADKNNFIYSIRVEAVSDASLANTDAVP